MKEQVLKQSQVFWKGLEQADTAAMRSVCDDKCFFVHIGGNCDLDREMDAFEKKVFPANGNRPAQPGSSCHW